MAAEYHPTTKRDFAARVPAYLDDIVMFAEECIRARDPRTGQIDWIELAPHQRDALREATRRDRGGRFVHKTSVFSWPKREGKTMLVGILVLWRLTCWRAQTIAILANSERQAGTVLYDQHVRRMIGASPMLRKLIPEEQEQTRTLRAMDNVLMCLPCNPDTVQGIAVDFLASDELHAIRKPRAFSMLSAQTESAGAQICVSTQAGSPVDANQVWLLYRASQSDANVFFSYSGEHHTEWGKRLAEDDRRKVTPAEWRYMHCNEWAGQGEKLFLAEDVERAAMDYRAPRTRAEWQELRASWGELGKAPCTIGVGLDRAGVGKTGDRSVWGAVARFDLRQRLQIARGGDDEGEAPWDVYRVVMCEVLPTGSEAEVLAVGRRTTEIFGRPDGTIFEMFGCSDLVEKFRDWGPDLEAMSATRKRRLFTRMWRGFAEGRIAFPAGAGVNPVDQVPGLLKAELVDFEYQCEGGVESTRYGTQTGHDDTVDSLGWAIESVADQVARKAQADDVRVSSSRKVYVARFA